MSYISNRIAKLRKILEKLPPIHEMTWGQKITYYTTLARIDELKTEWGIKDDDIESE